MAVNASIVPVRRISGVDVSRLGLSALAVILLLAALAFEAYRLGTPSDGTEVPVSANTYDLDGVTIDPRWAAGSPNGLEPGDRIVGMFERPVASWASLLIDPTVARPVIRAGDVLTFAIVREGRPVHVTAIASPYDPFAALADDWGVVILALTVELVGVYLFARRPAVPAAQALFIMGTGMFASTVPWALGLQVSDLTSPAGFWLYILSAGVAYTLFWCGSLHLALVFPGPYRLASSRARLLSVAYGLPIAGQLVVIIGGAVAGGGILAAIRAWAVGQAVLQVLVIAASVLLMGYSYFRLVDNVSRVQLRWVAGAAGLAAVSTLVLWFVPQLVFGAPVVPRGAVALLGLPFPLALAIAINQHHLFDLDRLVNRSLVYGGLTLGVLLTYAATVAIVGRLIPGNAPYAVLLLGAGAVAVAALPVRDGMQRQVNRLMYGDREEPDRALRRLGQRLEQSLDPQTVLPTLVEAVAEAMRAPYVAIELEVEGEPRVEAFHGSTPIDPSGPRDAARLPIVYRGQSIGWLVAVRRGADEPFSRVDERLLADLARQAAPAVEAVRLTADLRRSREELVTTREEERRRLRRDLHDEIGPALAGSLMKLGAARTLLATEPERASELMIGLESDARTMIEEIRRIARDLRPPALDELGLVGVLRQRIATFDGGTADSPLQVSLDAPESLPQLPAAIEVAALRIALEGLTNAARHSQATCARIELRMDDEDLVVSVVDDGIGIAADAKPGVGLSSMRERADEVGGTFEISTSDGGGTTIVARLPVSLMGPT